MITLQGVPGKGIGVVATQKILKGTRILSEAPIIKIPEDASESQLRESIRRQVVGLTSDQRQAFLNMCNIYPSDNTSRYLGIVRTNALPMDDGSGIFVTACRINHACNNNAQKGWNEGIKRHTVHALRDINEGEEITITYLGVLNDRRTRQEALRQKFKFTCTCGLCSLPAELSTESDRRSEEILTLDRRIGREGLMGILSEPERMLGYVYRQVQLYNQDNPDDVGLPRAFFDAAQIAAAHGDLARARVFTDRAADGWLVVSGDDCPKVRHTKQLAQNPSSHTIYGDGWRTAVTDVPQGLSPEEFEDWLWKRDDKKVSEKSGAFRNQVMFPSVIELPDGTEMEHDFFENRDGTNHRPRRHWCFLAEIVDFGTLVRLQMDVKDVAGQRIPIFFHTERRGSEIAPSQLRKGYTIAVLYATQHAFSFSEPGIRVENPALIKTFPLSLDEMLALSDRVQIFSAETDCIKLCQRAGWIEKNHKADCKLLRDNDLKGLLSLDDNKGEGLVGFPMPLSGQQ
ncbi:unnamed protein product [Fusarium equiseti]|uniref:SET domain-containing protein n=1 Tax=Fusarium equiseti TaxID=61235 RepID=A0A8J2IGI4_FUSEQ|nr:unnamed protein product [Fusarium equiseti]